MIYTVKGPIDSSKIGKTLAHEHFNWIDDEDFAGKMYFDRKYDESYNQKISDEISPLLEELKASGCETIVEASPPLGGQNLKLLYELSEKTGINIIASTGMNLSKYAHRLFSESFERVLAKRWIRDFENGLDTINGICIRPGMIKLLLDRGGVSDVDRAMLRAAAIASEVTGMPIHCHVLEARYMPKVIEIVEEMNLSPRKFVWAHGDKEGNREMILAVVEKGYWVGFDMIGEGTYAERKDLIEHGILHGYHDQVLLSQDYDLYEESMKEDGSRRYSAFFNEFIPYCISQGIPQKTLEEMITKNPGNFYNIE